MKWPKLCVPARNRLLKLPSKFESLRKHIMTSSRTSWTGVILTGKMTFWSNKCLGKVVNTMMLGVRNHPTTLRMTPCFPRLQLQTSRTGGILTGKMTFWSNKCLAKVVCTMKTGVLDILTAVRINPYPPRLQLQTSRIGGILTGKMTFGGNKCLAKDVHNMNDETPIRMNPCPTKQHPYSCQEIGHNTFLLGYQCIQ